MLEDQWLIWRCRHGDNDALRRIYQRYRQDMLSLAAAMTGDQARAEDVVHDVFIAFAQAVGGLKLRSSLRSYLLTGVANRVRSLYRVRAQQVVPLELEPAVGVQDWPDHAAITKETARRVREALAQLPDEQRETIILRLEGRLSFKAIAAVQQTSINTVNSRYRYGLEKLRSLLNNTVEL
jgi:RNA polymerase sigma-70 factor, ECF subfamily